VREARAVEGPRDGRGRGRTRRRHGWESRDRHERAPAGPDPVESDGGAGVSGHEGQPRGRVTRGCRGRDQRNPVGERERGEELTGGGKG
jgi:hypothetical protein